MAIPAGNFVSTTTRQRFFEKAVDNAYAGNVLFERLRSQARPWTGGRRVEIPTNIATRVGGGSFSGFGLLPTAQEDTRILMYADPAEYSSAPLTFSGIQLAVNKGPEAFLNLMATEFTITAKDLADKIGNTIYGDGTGNLNRDIIGLVYHVDDATNVITYQGQSRNTHTNLRSTLNAQVGALGFANLSTDIDAAQVGNENPTLMLTTPAVFSIIERLVTPTLVVNYGTPQATGAPTDGNQGIGLALGANRIWWKGVLIISDDKCPAGNIFTLNENHLFLYTLDYTNDVIESSKEGFAFTGFKKGQNQNAIVGHLLFAGQLVGDSPRTMARRTAVLT